MGRLGQQNGISINYQFQFGATQWWLSPNIKRKRIQKIGKKTGKNKIKWLQR